MAAKTDSTNISIAELARYCKVDKSTIKDWMDRGAIPYKLNAKGHRVLNRVEALAAAEERMSNRLREDMSKKKNLSTEFNAAKAIKETFNAKMARLQYEQKLRELIKVEVVEKRLFDLALGVRDALLTIPNKVSPELASMTDEKKINLFLDQIIREALNDISRGELEKWTSKKLKENKK